MADDLDVFLSHNSRDKPAEEEIAALLRGRGKGLTDDGVARLAWGITGTKGPM